MAIVNGELPEKPSKDHFGMSTTSILDILWDLSRICWNKSSKSRPTAQHLLGRLQFEVQFRESCRLEVGALLLSTDRQPNIENAGEAFIGERNTIWHSDSPGCESHEGHYCQARLTDDILWFLCDPGTLIGVSSVELGYTAEEARY